MADQWIGDTKGNGGAGRQRARQRRDRAPAAEVEPEREHHQHQDDDSGRGEVGHQRGLLLDQVGHLAAVADPQLRVVAGGPQPLHLGLHGGEQPLVGADAGRRLGRPDVQHQQAAIWRLVIPIAEGRARVQASAVARLHLGEVDGRGAGRGRLVVVEVDQQRVLALLLRGDPRQQLISQPPQLVEREVERAKRPEEAVLLVAAVLDRLHQVVREPAQPAGEVVGEPLQRLGALALQVDRQPRARVQARAERADRAHARGRLREQLLQAGAQIGVEADGEHARDQCRQQRGPEHRRAAAQQPGDEPAGDAVGTDPRRHQEGAPRGRHDPLRARSRTARTAAGENLHVARAPRADGPVSKPGL